MSGQCQMNAHRQRTRNKIQLSSNFLPVIQWGRGQIVGLKHDQ